MGNCDVCGTIALFLGTFLLMIPIFGRGGAIALHVSGRANIGPSVSVGFGIFLTLAAAGLFWREWISADVARAGDSSDTAGADGSTATPTTQTDNPMASAVATAEPVRPIQPVSTADASGQPALTVTGTLVGADTTGPRRQFEAMLSRTTAPDGNLTFEQGDVIDVLSDGPGEGWLTGSCGGRSGIFPANCKRMHARFLLLL